MTEPTPDNIEPDTVTPEPEPDDVNDDELDPRALAALQKLRRENQSLRSRLHEREEQVGAQAAREAVHHKAVIEAAAAQAGFIDPSDFTLAYPDPAPFLDEQFQDVVGDRVTEAARALLEQKPHLGRPVGAPPTERPIEGLRSGAAPELKEKPISWSSALRGR
jgi:hypothetical protein